MRLSHKIRTLLVVGVLAAGVLELGERLSVPGFSGLISIVKAEVGRPLTPVSVAGVARRTARRNSY
jgi:hypothetical protein